MAQKTQPKSKSSKEELSAKLKEQDPLSIVSGKLLAFSVSSEEQVTTTPPGKWANLFGFTYFRYTERGSGKEKASINGLINDMAEGVIEQLDESGVEAMKSIVRQQGEIEVKANENRQEISRQMFQWREATGDEARILAIAEENGKLLSELLEQRIEVYSKTLSGMNAQQRMQLSAVRKGESIAENRKRVASLAGNREAKRELTLLLGKFVTWATSTPEMSAVIDAGRPAVFFGFADLRIRNRQGNRPSTSLRRDASRIMLKTLDDSQREKLKELVDDQAALMKTYLETRGELAQALNPNSQQKSEIDWATIRDLCMESEVAEAKLGILQAQKMGEIVRSLSNSQVEILRGFVAVTNDAGVGHAKGRRNGTGSSKQNAGPGVR